MGSWETGRTSSSKCGMFPSLSKDTQQADKSMKNVGQTAVKEILWLSASVSKT